MVPTTVEVVPIVVVAVGVISAAIVPTPDFIAAAVVVAATVPVVRASIADWKRGINSRPINHGSFVVSRGYDTGREQHHE